MRSSISCSLVDGEHLDFRHLAMGRSSARFPCSKASVCKHLRTCSSETETMDFQALSSPKPDPQVVHAAIEEVRQIASQNVIAVLGAQITELKAQIDILAVKIDSQGAEIRAEIKAQTARIDVLQRVIWPLIGLLATTVLGLLYRVLTS